MNSASQLTSMPGQRIRVRGTVQGVGFRPFVAQLAERLSLTGYVANDNEGVLIEIWGSSSAMSDFIQLLESELPPLARVHEIEVAAVSDQQAAENFTIRNSQPGLIDTHVAADATICDACLAELFAPDNRRYHYPFINCTHCGPRFSIIKEMPYDRPFTSMATFSMCPSCEAEYHDPKSRRYHAQPNACPDCGPQIWCEDNQGNQTHSSSENVIHLAAEWIRQGKIVAIKGIGGFHLACDANNQAAVTQLRTRKQRDAKPLALMGRDLAQIQLYVEVDDLAQAELKSVNAPIVVMPAKTEHGLASNLAPDQVSLGFMLPYTPLHHLLMQQLDYPIVLTSGNLSETPQYIDNEEAQSQLSHIADGFLMHNRDIVNRLDDSVVRVMNGQVRVLRRGRGYAPTCLYLHDDFKNVPPVLAMGAELKSTFCLLRHGQAVVSQHIGDLENQSVLDEYIHSLYQYQNLYDFEPEYIATDSHPDYLSTQYGETLCDHFNSQLIRVQHHHAHIAAVMAENKLGLTEHVIGIALDGLGMGPKGELWGAEIMLASYVDYERLATIEEHALIGGSQAMREPWRNLYAHLHKQWSEIETSFPSLSIVKRLQQKPLNNINQMLKNHVNSPMSSSMGRVFDAVAAALGVCFDKQSYEGQAAMSLEGMATNRFSSQENDGYQIQVDWQSQPVRIGWHKLWQQLLTDMQNKLSQGDIAARFHHGLIQVITDVILQFSRQYQGLPIVLSGGVFQNKLLLEGVCKQLKQHNKKVLLASGFPSNDGALSLGQAVITAAQILTYGQSQRPFTDKD